MAPLRFFLLRHGQSEANVAELISSNPAFATKAHGLTEKGRTQAREAGEKLRNILVEENTQQTPEKFRKVSATQETGCAVAARPKQVLVLASDFLRTRHTAVEAVRALTKGGANEIELLNRKSNLNINFQPQQDGLTSESEAAVGETESHPGVIFDIRLRERYFGELDGQSSAQHAMEGGATTGGYESIWQGDEEIGKKEMIADAHPISNVELVNSVAKRVWSLVEDVVCNFEGTGLSVLIVAHGDVLQILQTCFTGVEAWRHRREVKHMDPAELREVNLKNTSLDKKVLD